MAVAMATIGQTRPDGTTRPARAEADPFREPDPMAVASR
jgi:hypothetical protein